VDRSPDNDLLITIPALWGMTSQGSKGEDRPGEGQSQYKRRSSRINADRMPNGQRIYSEIRSFF
jgi:hypothetical protein